MSRRKFFVGDLSTCYPRGEYYSSTTLINHDDSKNKKGWHSGPLEGEKGGQLAQATFAEANRSSGFLFGRNLVFVVDIRLRLQDNESFSVSADNDSKLTVCTWRLKDLNGKSTFMMATQSFEVNGSKWCLVFYPAGENSKHEQFSFFLQSLDIRDVHAKVTFSLVNVLYKERSVSRSVEHTFVQGANRCGFQNFMATTALRDESLGFLMHGWIELTAHVSALTAPDFVCTKRHSRHSGFYKSRRSIQDWLQHQ